MTKLPTNHLTPLNEQHDCYSEAAEIHSRIVMSHWDNRMNTV